MEAVAEPSAVEQQPMDWLPGFELERDAVNRCSVHTAMVNDLSRSRVGNRT